MSMNIKQIYDLNPSTSVSSNDLLYLGLSPYAPTDNSAIKYSDFITSLPGIRTIETDSGTISNADSSLKALGNAGASVRFQASANADITLILTSNPTYNTFVCAGTGNTTATGEGNCIFGPDSAPNITTGAGNILFGVQNAQNMSTGSFNFGLGNSVLANVTTGSENCAIGAGLNNITTGSYNLAVGSDGGGDFTVGSESSNICIYNSGVAGNSHVIRIGNQGSGDRQQNQCFIAGITSTASSSLTTPLPVYIESSTGKLAVGTSGGDTLWPPGFIQGFHFTLDLVGPPTTLTVSPGKCLSDSLDFNITLSGTPTITTSNLDTGSWTAGTVYAVWVFGDSTGVNGTILRFSASFTNPNVTAGWDRKRYIGYVVAQATGTNITTFTQRGNYNERTYTFNSQDASRTLLTNGSAVIGAPGTVSCTGITSPFVTNGILNYVYTPVSPANEFAISPAAELIFAYEAVSGPIAAVENVGVVPVNLDSSRQFGYFVANASDSLDLFATSFTETI